MSPQNNTIATAASQVSSLYTHCARVYESMVSEATEKTEGLVYRGSLTGLFNDVGIGQPYYSQVMNRLKDMGCLEQLKRGGGTVPSVWLLHKEPTLILYHTVGQNKTKANSAPQREELAQRQRDMQRRLQKLEVWARGQGAAL